MRTVPLARFIGAAVIAAAVAGCTQIGYTVANTATLFGAYERSTDHSYGEDPRQRLDIYSPRNARQRPVVIFWHGGSWTHGGRGQYRFVGAALAERGFVTVLPDYRLFPQVKFPLFVDDGARAIAWVQQHAAQFGGDPRQIILMGHSAGAHQAAFIAFNPEIQRKAGADPTAVVGLVGLSGPYALDPDSATLNTIFAAPYTHADWQPVRFVTPSAPPTFLAHGLKDSVVAVAHAEKLQAALRENGVRVDVELYPDGSHADTVAALSIPARGRAPVLDQIERFIASVTDSGGAAAAQ